MKQKHHIRKRLKLQLMIASYKKVSKKLYSVLVKEKGRERRKKKNVFIQSKLDFDTDFGVDFNNLAEITFHIKFLYKL